MRCICVALDVITLSCCHQRVREERARARRTKRQTAQSSTAKKQPKQHVTRRGATGGQSGRRIRHLHHHNYLWAVALTTLGRKGDNFKRYAKTNAGIRFRVPFEVVAPTTPHLESLDCQVVVTGPQNPLHVVLAASLMSNSGPSGVSFVSHALVLLARATKA